MTDDQEQPGWVYVMTNPVMPGRVKIGFTTTSVEQRRAELSRSTGVPAPFKVVYKIKSDKPRTLERRAHKHFADRRTNKSKEFFDVSVDEARRGILALSNKEHYQTSKASIRSDEKPRDTEITVHHAASEYEKERENLKHFAKYRDGKDKNNLTRDEIFNMNFAASNTDVKTPIRKIEDERREFIDEAEDRLSWNKTVLRWAIWTLITSTLVLALMVLGMSR